MHQGDQKDKAQNVLEELFDLIVEQGPPEIIYDQLMALSLQQK